MTSAPQADLPSQQLLSRTRRKLRTLLPLPGDELLSRGMLYGILAIYACTTYSIIVTGGGLIYYDTLTYYDTLNASWWFALPALLTIAATLRPIHNWLRPSIDRLVYDWHADPYAVISELQQHLALEPEQTPQAIMGAIVATIAATLRLPYVAIETDLGSGLPSTTYGAQIDHTERVTLPLAFRSTQIGALHTAARRPYESLSTNDLSLLHDLARQVGITLHAARLSDALQSSRAQLVTAREEERRRIRRDLHDGLGPTLASLRLQLSALRHRVSHNPDAERLIDELRADVRAATAEIRRLVYDLRPPMLDEFGLLGALHNLEVTGDGLARTIEAPAALPPLPAAIEVAIYRIAAEALHNIVRHAQATRCTIRIALDEAFLTLTVTDNGRGLPANYLAGVGHHSMVERAAELGGTVTILPAPAGGTSVNAVFPLKAVPND